MDSLHDLFDAEEAVAQVKMKIDEITGLPTPDVPHETMFVVLVREMAFAQFKTRAEANAYIQWKLPKLLRSEATVLRM
jgi:hypothetical protein